ncbi:MAG: proton-conducting transporter transmembrane domain-containing protein [Acidimicrobiales bacterium]
MIAIANIASTLMLVAPLPLLLMGLLVGLNADNHVRSLKTLSNGASWFALLCSIAATIAYVTITQHSHTYLSVPLPFELGSLAIRSLVNPLTLVMFLLVSFMGMIVSRFSFTYMIGDTHEGRFHKWLSLTVGAFLALIVADNIWAFWVLFIAASVSLHELLIFYRERPLAVIAARKKYLFSRIADVGLLIAFVLIARTTRHAAFSGLAQWMQAWHGSLPVTLQIATGLIVLAAILKSGIFPVHGWLIQVMEAPTQVSALLHAGLIYTGAFLLLRVSPMVTHVSWAWTVLIIAGLLSASVASLMMMIETNIKESLAYSTSAQLGFMLMECGLGLYSIAVVHIVAHSVYKAHSFLASASVVDNYRGPMIQKLKTKQTLPRAEFTIALAAVVTFGVALAFHVALQKQATLLTIGLIVAIAMGQLLLQAVNRSGIGAGTLLSRVALLSVLVCAAYFGLHDLSTYLLGTSIPSDTVQAARIPIWLLVLVAVVFLSLINIQQLLPRLQKSPFWQAVYVDLYNGLYVDLVFSQMAFLHALDAENPKVQYLRRRDESTRNIRPVSGPEHQH